jgi:hypothetical protein
MTGVRQAGKMGEGMALALEWAVGRRISVLPPVASPLFCDGVRFSSTSSLSESHCPQR